MEENGNTGTAPAAPGHDPSTPPGYIRFGPNPTQVIPIQWAEQILTQLAEKYASQFGTMLREAALQGMGQPGGRLRERKV